MAGWIGWALSLAALWLGLSTALGGDGKSRADEDLRHHGASTALRVTRAEEGSLLGGGDRQTERQT